MILKNHRHWNSKSVLDNFILKLYLKYLANKTKIHKNDTVITYEKNACFSLNTMHYQI